MSPVVWCNWFWANNETIDKTYNCYRKNNINIFRRHHLQCSHRECRLVRCPCLAPRRGDISDLQDEKLRQEADPHQNGRQPRLRDRPAVRIHGRVKPDIFSPCCSGPIFYHLCPKIVRRKLSSHGIDIVIRPKFKTEKTFVSPCIIYNAVGIYV